nr:cellulase N-terminal Ig-like domain-containing protein [Candidatus Sigynarchaeota archaeon]
MRNIASWLNDIKFSFVYLVVPVVLGLLFIGFSYYANFLTIFGRYEYSGTETMSPFGLLDIAHFRPVAAEEIMGWQFFFGNMHFFIIFALVMAGFFHLLRPRVNRVDGATTSTELVPTPRVKKIGIIALCGVGIIMVFELVFSIAGVPQSGLGSHIFIGPYTRDVPRLLADGFYVTNNVPYFPQMFLALIPILCGFGTYFYSHGLKSMKERGLIDQKPRIRGAGVVLFAAGLVYFIILAFPASITVQNSITGYTAYMALFFILNAMVVTGLILPITRLMIQGDAANDGRFKAQPVPFFVSILLLVLFIASIFVLMMPFLDVIGIGNSITFPGVEYVQACTIGGFIAVLGIVSWKHKDRPFVIVRGLSLVGGILSFGLLALYFSLNNSAGDLEIAWMYNSIIPSFFISCLTITFYVLGFKIKAWSIQLRGRFESLLKTKPGKAIASRGRLVSMVALVVAGGVVIPTILAGKILGEKPVIVINNVGYLPNQEKTFFMTMQYDSPGVNGTYDLIEEGTGQVVRSGTIVPRGLLWQRYYWKGDISSVTTPGSYHIIGKIGSNVARSNTFTISSTYLDDVFTTGQFWFYYARCGTRVVSVHPNSVGHEPCHTHDAWFLYKYPNGTLQYRHSYEIGMNLSGGYHDSGDYNVYGTMMAHLSYSLPYAFDRVPGFFTEPSRMSMYPQNDSIPDIMEEAWHAVSWWMNRWYEPEQRYFDSNELGANGSIRWTVFGPPEYEEDFGQGRWVSNDEGGGGPYENQFIQSSFGLLVTASIAAMARLCEAGGYYTEDITQMKGLANKSRYAYKNTLGNDWMSLASEIEMFKLTGNATYFTDAQSIFNAVIGAASYPDPFPDYRAFAL